MKILVKIVPTARCIEYWMRRNQYEMTVDGKVEGRINNVYLIGAKKDSQRVTLYLSQSSGRLVPKLVSRKEAADTLKTWRELENNSK